MREEKFKMERPGLVQEGQKVEVVEINTSMNYSYIIEPAVAMSGCFPAGKRIKSQYGTIKTIEHTPRGYIVTAAFDEEA